mmetsp:Transcript_1864/g.3260  ORF Transcript_1864/g.3260 Transcript_1864/m.3260 type:complete len:258 (-) Transcript_1864:2644-3417(-)
MAGTKAASGVNPSGYETIGSKSLDTSATTATSSASTLHGVRAYDEEHQAPSSTNPNINTNTNSNNAANGYQSLAENAKILMSNAKDRMASIAQDVSMNVNVDTQPIQPNEELGFKDRCMLVYQSARPWSEVFAWGKFNRPTSGEVQARFSHNAETFFYNYVILGVGFLLCLAVVHPWGVLSLLLASYLAFYLYVLHPDPIFLFGSVSLDKVHKHVIVGVALFLALVFGHAGKVFVMTAIFLFVFVGLHSIFREHSEG